MFGPKTSRTLTVACWSVESIECQQVPSLCFNLLLLFFFFFFRLRYTRLALNYLFGLKREGTVVRRDSALIHPHYANTWWFTQPLSSTDVQCLNMFNVTK